METASSLWRPPVQSRRAFSGIADHPSASTAIRCTEGRASERRPTKAEMASVVRMLPGIAESAMTARVKGRWDSSAGAENSEAPYGPGILALASKRARAIACRRFGQATRVRRACRGLDLVAMGMPTRAPAALPRRRAERRGREARFLQPRTARQGRDFGPSHLWHGSALPHR